MFVAAYFTWSALSAGRAENFDYALAAAALGLCAWFMRYRFELKDKLLAAETDERRAENDVEPEMSDEPAISELQDSGAPPHVNSQRESQINYVK